jgi:hypothetical protein
MKGTSWDETQCSLIEVHRLFRRTYSFHFHASRISRARKFGTYFYGLLFDPEGGGCTFVRDVRKLQPDYAASHRGGQCS